MSSQKSQIVRILCLISFLILGAGRAWGLFHIVRNNSPACSIVTPENPSAQEELAAEELNYFIEKFSGEKLPESPDSEPLPTGNVILIGTPDSNRYIGELLNNGLLLGGKQFSAEEFIVKVVNEAERDILAIASGQGKGVIYGVYAFAEKMIESITELAPVDLDFHVNPVDSLFVETLNMRSAPFYPIRCALSQESLQWMSRHRVNVSGAEGVWSGTGINDGLGTAFKYVNDWQFNDMQDETSARRLTRIADLRARLMELTKRGIDSCLFMYVMGEPTKAMMDSHPELLEEEVLYRFARNGYSYRPISWTKPEARELIRELVKSIVRTYSPWLSGFHLRSWGGETRAPGGKRRETTGSALGSVFRHNRGGAGSQP